MSETSKLNLHQKMLQATMKIERVAKNLSVTVGKGSYKAVSQGDVLKAVKPIEIELGIYSYPKETEVVYQTVLESEKEYNGQKSKSIQIFVRLKTVYRFVNIDNTTEFIDITTYGDGVDPQDKAPGKSMTYSDKYALLRAYKIETGDDPDQEGSKEHSGVKKATPITETQALLITQAIGADVERLAKMLGKYGVSSIDQMSAEQASEALSILNKGKR